VAGDGPGAGPPPAGPPGDHLRWTDPPYPETPAPGSAFTHEQARFLIIIIIQGS